MLIKNIGCNFFLEVCRVLSRRHCFRVIVTFDYSFRITRIVICHQASSVPCPRHLDGGNPKLDIVVCIATVRRDERVAPFLPRLLIILERHGRRVHIVPAEG